MARYRIVSARSRIAAEARSSVHPIRVDTAGLSGWIELDVADGRLRLDRPPRGHVEVDTEKLRTGNGLYDGELERRLEVRRYPTVRGDVTDVQTLDGGRYRVRGDLTFHGATRPVHGDVSIRSATDRAVDVEGHLVFDMRDFGLQPPRLLMLKVHPEVRVHGRIVAERVN